jgi:hypothetical protein
MHRKPAQKDMESLSERCRVALERRYGFEIPTPNCMSKKAHRNRQYC